MEVILIGIALIVGFFLLIYFIIKLVKRGSESNENESEEDCHQEIAPSNYSHLRTSPSASDIRNAPKGKYSWDENGCVFEINEDGSVTVVGTYDITDLQLTPGEQLEKDGLIEMLPRVWSILINPDEDVSNMRLWYIADDDYFRLEAGDNSDMVSGIKRLEPIPQSGHSTCIQKMLYDLTTIGKGTVILMPTDDKEFILSLGAQACLKRCFDEYVNVAIANPSEIGALWAAINSGVRRKQYVSFAFGTDDNYTCCNLNAENNSFQVTNLLSSSIILPLRTDMRNQYIAKGAFIYSLLLAGALQNISTSFMFPHQISLIVRNGDHIVKIYDMFDSHPNYPTSQTLKSIELNHGEIASFVIGSNELISDLFEDENLVGSFNITVCINESCEVKLITEVEGQTTNIIIGELIG